MKYSFIADDALEERPTVRVEKARPVRAELEARLKEIDAKIASLRTARASLVARMEEE